MNKREPSSLGEYLQATREQADMSQRQAAAKGGIHHSFLARLESGEVKSPDPGLLQRYCEAIGGNAEIALSYLGVRPITPEPRVYFRRAFGVDADDAEILAQLVEDYRNKKKEGGSDEETD